MYSLIVSTGEWREGENQVQVGRFLERTSDRLAERFRLAAHELEDFPALMMAETQQAGQPPARFASLSNIRMTGRFVSFDCSFKADIPSISNSDLARIAGSLGIEDFEFHRGHWAVKDINLFEVLYAQTRISLPAPTVFKFDHDAGIDPRQLSVMMPFSAPFDPVYEKIREVAEGCVLKCNRADNIWNHDVIIQDIASLIFSSSIIVCDCTGKNPNVFYEVGIAHALGRKVVLITQSADDVPFDVQHLRYISYLNNDQGLDGLGEVLTQRIRAILTP